jgi:TDG/mug DNA glycosylase family protein
MAEKPWKPTKEQVLAARDSTRRVRDVIGPKLKVLFVGINPGLYTAAVRHHFGRPGNRFWPALHAGGFTDRVLSPFEEDELLAGGYGITNMVDRATLAADELTADELRAGARVLEKKVLKYRPRFIAVLGVGSYRTAFQRPKAAVGLQEETIGSTRIWLLPNPSGLNAHYKPIDLARLFRALHTASAT